MAVYACLPVTVLVPVVGGLVSGFNGGRLYTFNVNFTTVMDFILFVVGADGPCIFLTFAFFSNLNRAFLILRI